MAELDATTLWTELSGILLRSKDYHYGEFVSQLDHALQTARLAREAAASTDEIIAALLHDIGHMLETAEPRDHLGAESHEEIGARFLEKHGFGPSVVNLVRGHVAAKRYLLWRDESYFEKLSIASRQTLDLQGGPMTDKEADEFARSATFRARLRLRAWDDRAKVQGLKVAPLPDYRDAILNHLSRGN